VTAGWERFVRRPTLINGGGNPLRELERWAMLTLGLMEGFLAGTIGLLLLVGAANENAPLHKILGPLVVLITGTVAYMIHASGKVSAFSDVVGLSFFALVAFYAPLAFMRAAWKAMRAMDAAPGKRQSAKTTPTRVPQPEVAVEMAPPKAA
jgi:hypothetical protein